MKDEILRLPYYSTNLTNERLAYQNITHREITESNMDKPLLLNLAI